MEYTYTVSTRERKLVKGRLNAATEAEAAGKLLQSGYQVLSIKSSGDWQVRLQQALKFSFTAAVKPKEVIMFSRQLALLIDSGIDIVTALELLSSQTANRGMKSILESVVSDLRGGSAFSTALSRYPKVFPVMYHRSIAAGEQGGNLSVVLRRMADYMERSEAAAKKVKGALTYPITVFILAIVVAIVLVFFVLPTFTTLYASMGADLPAMSKALIGGAKWLTKYGAYIIVAVLGGLIAGFLYIKTPNGRNWWDRLILRSPVVGYIVQLNELARCSRTISMLVNVGLPLPDILTMCAQSSGNTFVTQSINEVRQDMLRGEGLAQPMAKRPIFLPLMVQMVGVGEKTGNLGTTLTTVAESYEHDADDRTMAAVGLIQPALTITMAIVVGFIVVAMVSAMYGIYGQLG